jgi:two-component system LytT family response regulator
MREISAMIVEDEQLARELIRNYLKDFPNIHLLGEYADGFSGIRAINMQKPALVFLDIRIPKITGLEMLELLDYQPAIIFTTAYNQYAIRAFEMNAVDYLLKPFSRERFMQAVERAQFRFEQGEIQPFSELEPSVETGTGYLKRVVVKEKNNIQIIPTPDITYFEAQDDYVMIYTDGSRYMKYRRLKYYEENLDPTNFVRVHRSYIVRIDQISRLEKYEKESYKLFLINKAVIPVSKSGYKKLKESLHF